MAGNHDAGCGVRRFKFTKSAVEGVTPPADKARDTCYDNEIPTLALRITQAGSKTFYLVKRVGHKMVWHKLGKFPDMTVEHARKAAYAALADFSAPDVADQPDAVRRKLRKMPTVAEFFVEYGKRYGQTKRAWRDDQQRFRDHASRA